MNWKYLVYRFAFELLWLSQLPTLVRAVSRARGLIFTLHRVLPEVPADFSPNSILQITPDYLEFAILRMRKLGFETVSMDEAIRRTRSPESQKRFVVFSFDDAYKDNLKFALPVLERLNCPFILYVPTAFVDGIGTLWWQALEDVIAMQNAIATPKSNGEIAYMEIKSLGQKQTAFRHLYAQMRNMGNVERTAFIKELAKRYGLDTDAQCRQLIMDWPELSTIASSPLCTIGAHTVHHHELSALDEKDAENEMEQGAAIIAAQLGERPKHFSYPYGGRTAASDREYALAARLGFETAVTTKPGAVYYRHGKALTQLPRISLNGDYQSERYIDVYAAGALFSIAKRLI